MSERSSDMQECVLTHSRFVWKLRREAGRRPAPARYGCFLPDLTGLASGSSTANLPCVQYNRCGPSTSKGVGISLQAWPIAATPNYVSKQSR